jgi:NTP pyrophosphatase (non-canonical NTP hydrolase)
MPNEFNYIAEVLKTESCEMGPLRKRISEGKAIRLLHAGMGMCTESGEFLDTLKKHIFYGKAIDEVNLMEEVGDLLWYCAVALDELGYSFEECQKINIAKLRKRYGEKFTSEQAINRDLGTEREILESGC